MEPELNKQIAQAQQQLRECIVARQGLEDDFGRLIVDLYAKHITRLTRDICHPDKYAKDHMGYVKALSDLNAYKTILKELQIAANPLREQKLREKLAKVDG